MSPKDFIYILKSSMVWDNGKSFFARKFHVFDTQMLFRSNLAWVRKFTLFWKLLHKKRKISYGFKNHTFCFCLLDIPGKLFLYDVLASILTKQDSDFWLESLNVISGNAIVRKTSTSLKQKPTGQVHAKASTFFATLEKIFINREIFKLFVKKSSSKFFLSHCKDQKFK